MNERTGWWVEAGDIEGAAVVGIDPLGEWMPDTIYCSKCRCGFRIDENLVEEWKYCPNCGTRMED